MQYLEDVVINVAKKLKKHLKKNKEKKEETN